MWEHYGEDEIDFSVGDTRFSAVNLVYERFLRSIPGHVHGSGSYEIHYISEGYGYARIDGETYEITPGTLYVTGPHVEHAQTPKLEDPMCEYCVYLKIGKRRKNQDPGSQESRNDVVSAFVNTPLWFGQDTQGTGGLMKALFTELKEKRCGYEIQTEALFLQLLVTLVRNYEKETGGEERKELSLADKTSVIIEEYFLYQYRELSLEELAGKLGLGIRQTERLLKKYYGKNFRQKKTEARMAAAAVLLAEQDRSISGVSEELGYSSIEHFSSAFKNYYGLSPRQYRKQPAGN